ncbi:hypothetical protein ACFWMR_01065 [Amycolatopsis thailandensis]|uniref:hypothetical protein n=1 Tax=Amycolatopsis thailandensis TaxID=589330 RepID=UPI003657A9AE
MATTDIATAEEIDRRVEAADTARRAKRSAAAKEVGELAQRRTALVEQLDEVERQLGEVLADASDVLDIDELARFTNIPAADLTAWLTPRKPPRATKKKRPAAITPSGAPSATKTATNGQAPVPPEPAVPRTDSADAPERVTAGVT